MRLGALLPLAGAGGLLGTAPAHAQSALEAPDVVAVGARSTPGYEPLGLSAGGFRVMPRLNVAARYDDNIYARSANVVGDAYLALEPSVVARSDWSRHSLTFRADGAVRRYATITSENSERYHLSVDGRLDLTQGTNLTAGGGHDRQVETRGTLGDPFNGGRPIVFYQDNLRGGAQVEFNRLQLQGTITASHFDYRDAAIDTSRFDQDYRDHWSELASLRIGYELSPILTTFVRGTRNWMLYGSDRTGIDRSSRGASVEAGVQFGITQLLSGQVSAGYITQSFRAAVYPDFHGLDYEARLIWNPTTLVTATFSAGRRVADTGLANAGATISSTIEARADYELLRNVIIGLRVQNVRDNYRGIDRRDSRFTERIGIRYALNRLLGVTAFYQRTDQVSSGSDRPRSYQENQLGAALSVAF